MCDDRFPCSCCLHVEASFPPTSLFTSHTTTSTAISRGDFREIPKMLVRNNNNNAALFILVVTLIALSWETVLGTAEELEQVLRMVIKTTIHITINPNNSTTKSSQILNYYTSVINNIKSALLPSPFPSRKKRLVVSRRVQLPRILT